MLRQALRLSLFAALAVLTLSSAVADGFEPEIRIGNYGTVPGIIFAPDGTGHLIYRRATSIFYRRYNGSAWSAETQVNNDQSRCEAEFLDRNQPKITLDPSGFAYIVWGGQVRNIDKNLYLRVVNPDGTFKSAIKKYQYKPELLNPEEVAVSYDPTTNKLHLYDIFVGDPTKIEDGHYDLTINPQNLQLQEVTKLGPPQKNVYGFTGPRRAYGFARLHQIRFYRSRDNGAYDETYLHPEKLQYSVGALRFVTTDDRFIHFGIVSTNPANGAQRDVTYMYYDANTDGQLGEVMVDPQFDSPHGLAFPAVTPSGNVFITYDDKRSSGNSAPIYAIRRGGVGPNAPFSTPAIFPDYPADAGAEAPMPFAIGESIYVVWGDKIRNGLYARVFTFGDLGPVPAVSGEMLGVLVLLVTAGAFGLLARRRRALALGPVALLALVILGTGCGGGDDDPNDPDVTPTPVVRTSIGYQLLGGVDRLDEPKSGVARLFSSHNPADGQNRDYNWYRRRDADGTYVLVDHTGPGVITRIWMTARVGGAVSSPGFSDNAMLKIYVDGSTTPLLSINPNRFFAGQTFPFTPPLVGQHSTSKGFFSYVPISFATSVKVTLNDPVQTSPGYLTDQLFYQINLLDLAGQGPVQGSPVRQGDGSLSLSADDQAAYQQIVAQWRDPLAFANQMSQAREVVNFPGPVSGTAVLAELTGPARIRGLRLRAPGLTPANLESVRLRIRWDNEVTPSVDVPLGTAWGAHFVRTPFSSLVQGATGDGTLYLRLPMPFRQNARLELVNTAGGSLPISGEVFYDRVSVSGTGRYFHATFNAQNLQTAQRLVMAEASGSGHLIGMQLVVDVNSDPQALEGDEFITVDGTSLYKGTGTEDYFNAHWFFEGGQRSLPLTGTTSIGARLRPDVHTHRFMIPDLVPFSNNLRFELENGNAPGNTDSYRSVAFYYQQQ